MDRADKVFHKIDRRGMGLEIGPSHSPFAPKSEGYNVHVMDHLSKEKLIEKYRGHNVDLGKIEDVDYVWSGQDFKTLVGARRYDYIIASHVVEYMPDLIGFLRNCNSVLAEGGVISLVVPDKRYCFDHFRPVSSLAPVMDNYLNQSKIHSAGTVAEYFLNAVSRNGQIAWDGSNNESEFSFIHDVADAKRGIRTVISDGTYLDVHGWCFTPSSFRLLMADLFSLGLVTFREIGFFDTAGCEFFITLADHGVASPISRLQLLAQVDSEQRSS